MNHESTMNLCKAAYSQQRWLAMPHAVEEFAPGPPSPQNGALLAAGFLGPANKKTRRSEDVTSRNGLRGIDIVVSYVSSSDIEIL